MISPILTDQERSALAVDFPAWDVTGHSMERHLAFSDFSEAFGFMVRVALAAEAIGHHPDWSNSWNRVSIVLSTHDSGGLTALDLKLARLIDRLLGEMKGGQSE